MLHLTSGTKNTVRRQNTVMSGMKKSESDRTNNLSHIRLRGDTEKHNMMDELKDFPCQNLS
jgi:hypothetical protein